MPRILKLSPYYYPEEIASTHMSRDLNEALFDSGYTIENFVPTPSRGITESERNKYKKIKYECREDGRVVIHRFSMFKEGKNPIQRAVRYILVNYIQFNKGSSAENVDLIFAASTPPTQGFLCAMVKKRLSKKYGRAVPFVYNLQDIFPDSLVNANMTKKGSLIWKIGRKIENYAYKYADIIITISDEFKNNIMNKGVPESKIVVIPNWVNTENVFYVKREENKLFDKYKLDRSFFYICYSGNIGHSQNMDLLLDVAKEIDEKMPNVRFVLIGEGAAKASVINRIDNDFIKNVIVLPFQDYSDIAEVFSLGNVGLIISKPGVGQSSVPSKTWSIMAAHRPILASFDMDSDLARLILTSKSGIVADSGNKKALINAIDKLSADQEICKEFGENGSEYLKNHANKDVSVAQYIQTLNDVLNQ